MSRSPDPYVSRKRFDYKILLLQSTINKALSKNRTLVDILTQKTRNETHYLKIASQRKSGYAQWKKKISRLNNALERVRRNWRGKIQTIGQRDATYVVRLTRNEYTRLRALIGKRKGK